MFQLLVSNLNLKAMSISVTNVTQLYAAVNNPNNAGKTISLARGIYILDPAMDTNLTGRLELQPNMELHGQVNNPASVIIDISRLPSTSYGPVSGGPNRTGAIRLGKGNNVLSGLTVIGNNNQLNTVALSVIDTDLKVLNAISKIKISNCIVGGGRIGINVRNVGSDHDGRKIDVQLLNNVLVNNQQSDPGTQQGQGIVIQHANGVSNATIKATLKGNFIYGNTIGVKIFNNSSNNNLDTLNNKIAITSKDDTIVMNKLGISIGGGIHTGGTKKINGNSIVFNATHTTIQNNAGIIHDSVVEPSGIFVTGGSVSAGNVISNNKVNINLTDCTLSGNQHVDIMAYGAYTKTNNPLGYTPPIPPLPGTFNIVNIQLNGTSATANVVKTDCFPTETPSTNKVTVTKMP